MHGFKHRLQHRLNPLHVYCRLRDLGLRGPTARRLCALYERLVFGIGPDFAGISMEFRRDYGGMRSG